MNQFSFDFVIIGSGFGGSISAMRLAQKGYRVAVVEKGRRFHQQDYAQSNRDIKKFLWVPILKCFGIQQMTLLKGVMVLHGAGVGGGSLVYANTLMQPEDKVFDQWPKDINWISELKPFYQKAKKILGVTTNQFETSSDKLLKKLGADLGVENTYHLTEVGVYFGEPGLKKTDPYFQGHGPDRTGCTACGACMVGCRIGAKNTLDKNYLFFAEKWGTQIFDLLRVEEIIPEQQGYTLSTFRSDRWLTKGPRLFANHVIIAAGVIGTLELLFKNKLKYKTLKNISDELGKNIRTNGESLCGATQVTGVEDLSIGVAIGSAIHPDEETKIEPVRYPAHFDLMKFLAVPLTSDGNFITRPMKMFIHLLLNLPTFLKLYFFSNWSKNAIILLVMKTIDQTIDLGWGRSIFTLYKKGLRNSGNHKKIPSYMPIAQKASKILAQHMQGVPQNVITEVILGTPATAHILGGCSYASSSKSEFPIGVIDQWNQINGYKNLFVCDGSVIPGNLGVNPSLTISALAERFTTQFSMSHHIDPLEYEKRCQII